MASLFPLNGLVSADAASVDGEPRRAPLLADQVTELEDAVFVAASLNHAVGDGTTFWHFVNTWSDLSRSGGATCERPPPVLERWFLDTCPVPVPLKFAKLEDAIRRHEPPPPLQECFFHFSAESVRKLKARANAEVNSMPGAATATISSLQTVLGHLWRPSQAPEPVAEDHVRAAHRLPWEGEGHPAGRLRGQRGGALQGAVDRRRGRGEGPAGRRGS